MMEVVTLGTVVRPPSIVRADVRADGVCVLTLDDPNETHNTITPQLGAELAAALDDADRDGKVKAIVLRSAKRDSFLVGANIDYLATIKFAKDAEDASLEVGRRFARIARAAKPVVACVHGAALGGGFELSLACAATVATDDPRTALGLPEVKLGLMPAANGLLRVAARAGLIVAIDLGLTGRSLKPKKARALGLVDEVVTPSIALACACELALRLADGKRPPHHTKRADLRRVLLERNPIGRAILFRRARAAARAESHGHYPATERMLDVLACFGRKGFDEAAKVEARLFGELVVSETSHRLVELFFATTASKKGTGLEIGETATPARVDRIAVVGAGLMGAGVACVSVQAGLDVRMKDTDDVALGRGLAYVKTVLDERARRGSTTALETERTFSRLSGTVDYAGIASADLVVEAVFEELDVKRAVIADLERLVKETCVIASNTSSLPIAQIAQRASRPDRILGMHYFSPVHRMPLLEVVRTRETSPHAIATAVALGKRQGKTVIVVRDAPGFYTTRILAPYLNEAAQLLAEGVPVDVIDRALVDWGFPAGPLAVLDAIGIDVASHVTSVMETSFGARMRAPETLVRLVADDRKGKKNARGFYLHDRSARPSARVRVRVRVPKRVDDTVYDVLGVTPRLRPMPEEISVRCTLRLVNEALRCLDEGVLRSPRDGDVGAIFGIGFPAFRGGPFRYVDVLGAPELLRRTRSLEQRLGARFEPAPMLVDMARTGKRFYP